MKVLQVLAVLTTMAANSSAQPKSSPAAAPPGTITNPVTLTPFVDIAASLGVSKFVAALQQAGLVQEIKSQGHGVTILAPTDDAIDKANITLTDDVLRYHIITDRAYRTDQLADDQLLQALNKKHLRVHFKKDGTNTVITFGPNITFAGKEELVAEGQIITIDNVLIPPRKDWQVVSPDPPLPKEEGKLPELVPQPPAANN